MMKKIFFLISILSLLACKNENSTNLVHEEAIIYKSKNIIAPILTDNLPFGNPDLKNYPFKLNVWIDDLNNEKLQSATKFLYKDDYANLNEKQNLDLSLASKRENYFLLNGQKIEAIEQSIITSPLYLLIKNDIYALFYVEVEISDNENNIFENQKGGYIITLDSKNEIISSLKFNGIFYFDNESVERWNYANVRLSFIDKEKIISVYDFSCKEWDLNYEFRLNDKVNYRINELGQFIKL